MKKSNAAQMQNASSLMDSLHVCVLTGLMAHQTQPLVAQILMNALGVLVVLEQSVKMNLEVIPVNVLLDTTEPMQEMAVLKSNHLDATRLALVQLEKNVSETISLMKMCAFVNEVTQETKLQVFAEISMNVSKIPVPVESTLFVITS